MVRGLGYNLSRLRLGVFALGTSLAVVTFRGSGLFGKKSALDT